MFKASAVDYDLPSLRDLQEKPARRAPLPITIWPGLPFFAEPRTLEMDNLQDDFGQGGLHVGV